jgi:hypothetical protein
MTLDAKSPIVPRRLRLALVAATMIALVALTGGCSVVRAVNKIAHTVGTNKTRIDAFTQKVQSGESTTFEAIYQTTGTSPATITYAVEKPYGLVFKDTPSRASSSGDEFNIVVNQSGEYACTPPSASQPRWSCEKVPSQSISTENQIIDFYTPSHWVTFLNDFAIGAGFAGDTVGSSNMSVNGFAMHCVDLEAPGVPGTSKICTTVQGILGYVKVATDSTSFEIRTYTAHPPASLFQLPPGAKITTVTIPATTTTS